VKEALLAWMEYAEHVRGLERCERIDSEMKASLNVSFNRAEALSLQAMREEAEKSLP
jgi:hypothetical protein